MKVNIYLKANLHSLIPAFTEYLTQSVKRRKNLRLGWDSFNFFLVRKLSQNLDKVFEKVLS